VNAEEEVEQVEEAQGGSEAEEKDGEEKSAAQEV